MSENETLKSATDPNCNQSETSKTNQEDNTRNVATIDIENPVASIENQNVPVQDTECKIPRCAENETIEIPTKEINTTVAEIAKDVNASEAANQSSEKPEDSAITEVKENEQSPNVPEIRQQTSIGAGDTCFVPRRDENAVAQKLDEGDAITPVSEQTPSKNDKLLTENDQNETDLMLSKLKEEVQKTSDERDSYQKKLESTEKKLAELQSFYDALLKGEGNEVILRRMVDQLRGKLIQTSLQLEDRIRVVANQEKQINALNSQVASLKEVESLTRSLLQIRNMEVKHLQAEVDDMEVRINEERERYNTMINKMDAAVKLNADLKKEYETQLCLFRDLREKYEEKVSLLTEEKRALEANAQPVPK
ncbi:unnamed protein product [Xylocopa violacea]|uniref:Tropomyosin n=1 Tax=Xylocopa violacea TaxID=135666 RepID=A0ABP1PH91_XYLVO